MAIWLVGCDDHKRSSNPVEELGEYEFKLGGLGGADARKV
jgi:hypothetical protein